MEPGGVGSRGSLADLEVASALNLPQLPPQPPTLHDPRERAKEGRVSLHHRDAGSHLGARPSPGLWARAGERGWAPGRGLRSAQASLGPATPSPGAGSWGQTLLPSPRNYRL